MLSVVSSDTSRGRQAGLQMVPGVKIELNAVPGQCRPQGTLPNFGQSMTEGSCTSGSTPLLGAYGDTVNCRS